MSEPNFVPVIALVGGVGSGKSAVAGWLAASRNVVVVDADHAAHQVLKYSNVKNQIRTAFGDSVFDEHGEVHRASLGRLVFGNSAQFGDARATLEGIVHPEIRTMIAEQINEAKGSPGVEAVLLDAAVLFEAGWDDLCDSVVFVETPFEKRLEHVATSRNWTEKMLEDREASQLPLDQKKDASDVVILNSQALQQAGTQLDNFVTQVIREHH